MAMLNILAAVLGSRLAEEAATPEPGAGELTQAEFEAFHAETSKALWSYLARLTGDASLAEDVAQESYLRFLSRPSRRQDPAARRAYLFRIATNLVRDRWRRNRFHADWDDELLNTLIAPDPAFGVDGKVDVRRVFPQLRPRERALLWLAYVEGHSHHEIAEILGLRSLSVRVLLSRARKRLKRQLEVDAVAEEKTVEELGESP